ncbi:hypothetical protein Cwoe_5192 [Conexibacter woesei DSM 14684]|uniref:Uncharacterized protein n=2 Tax=Conexibacter TaxID=191494 RepID=D3FEA8_CONWI|nr:hypothetical protein Cwoe_5192 [Conexibacter woesei DSM 14684]
MELFAFVLRGAIETAINLRYLITHGSDATYEAFVRHSLKLEKQLRDRVVAAIEERGGVVMPMEHGMLEGIEAAFRTAEVEPEDVDPVSRAPWSKGGAFGRFKALGVEDLYGPYFGVQSSYVHGAWQELVQHHLEVQPDGRFLPRATFDEGLAVAPLLIAVDVLGGATVDYLRAAAPPTRDRDVLEGRIDVCGENASAIRAAYRRFRGMPDLTGA